MLQSFPVGSNDIIEAVSRGTLDPDGIVELGELVDGRHPGRADDQQLTIYKSVGVAIQDAAAAAVVLAAAQRANTGTSITI